MPDPDELDQLVERITIDAYGDEGYWAFSQAFEDESGFPLDAKLAGMDVVVTAVDFDGDEHRGLIAITRHSGHTYRISLLNVEFARGTPAASLSAAYRHWLG